jgi:TP901 family phage tail tape measure protein
MASREQKIINVEIKGVNDLLKLKKELQSLKKEQQKVKEVNKETEKDWIDKERAINKATQKYKENRKELTKLNRQQKSNKRSAVSFGKGLLKTAAAITVVVSAVRLLSRAAVAAFKTFTEFEFSMAKVRAISGATNEEFTKLEQSAKELGRTTFFTAKQVAELQVNFSKLGFSAQEILNLQEATLDLAMATGSDLARSAMVAGSAVRGFGLSADEATRVVDVMAVAFTNSALDIEKWQTSMTKVSAIAASIGVDIEGTAAVMGALSDTGIEASIAGTSLRNIFLKMANPTSTLAKRIGFVVQSTDDMIKALRILKKGQIGQLEMQTLVDKRQVIAMESMIQNIDVIETYTTKLNNATGAGAEMAAIMENTSKGAFKKLQSALEGLALAFSENFAPVINKVADALTFLTGTMTRFAEIPVSEKLRNDKKEMNALFNAIRDNNTQTKTAVQLVQKANRLYAEQLGYELTAIDNAEQLYFSKLQVSQAQRELNDSFEDSINLQAASELLIEAQRQQLEQQAELNNLATEISNAENEAKKAGLDLNKDLETSSKQLTGRLGADAKSNMSMQMSMGISTTILTDKVEKLRKKQKELQEEIAKAPSKIEGLKQAYKDLGGILDGTVAKPLKCPEGSKWDDTLKKCVPITEKGTRDFGREMAIYQNQLRKRMALGFLMEEDFNQKILDKKKELALAEFNLLKKGDIRKEKAYLKYLKAVDSADKSRYNTQVKNIDDNYKKEKRTLDAQARDNQGRNLQHIELELALEKKMLKEKLNATKKYSKDYKKIQDKIAQSDAKIAVNKKAQLVEAAEFSIELATTIADATFQIMSNNLNQEKAFLEKSITDKYDWELTTLDKLLNDKEISQADYDGKKLISDSKRKEEEIAIAKEFSQKEKNIAKSQAIINGAVAITKAYAQGGPLGVFVVPMLIASTAAQLAVIESQQFAKGGLLEEFADGGMVQGKSHAQGGEKFAVGGRVVELEGGEAVINKKSTSMFKNQLSAMNSAGGGVKFADGGLLNSSSFNNVKFNSAQFNQPSSGGKVVVVESDITNSQSKVKAIQSNASF